MAYEMVMPYHLHMPSYFLETFTEYPYKKRNNRSYSFCTPSGIRTLDPLIKSQLLYQLS
jgi:hypothetical protein